MTELKVVVRGAEGAIGSRDTGPISHGGRVHAVIPVTPGETLVVYVGGDATGSTGGFNGGADGGAGSYSADGYGGGGASDVRRYLGGPRTAFWLRAGEAVKAEGAMTALLGRAGVAAGS